MAGLGDLSCLQSWLLRQDISCISHLAITAHGMGTAHVPMPLTGYNCTSIFRNYPSVMSICTKGVKDKNMQYKKH